MITGIRRPEMSLKLAEVTEVSSVDNFIKERLENRGVDEDDAFMVLNLSEIQDRIEQWHENFPRVEPFFALKAQTNGNSAKLFAANKCGFDVASMNEINTALNAGAVPSDLIYAQAYKQPSHLHFALQRGIISVCDSVDEIKKVGELAARLIDCTPKILLRILPDDKEGNKTESFSAKYGASIELLPELAKTAKESNVNISGISFHVGAHCHSAKPYLDTLKLSRVWWDTLETQYSCKLEMLDIGGGFPALPSRADFRRMAKRIDDGIDECYRDIRNCIRIIAEPGRFMVTTSLSVVTNVIAEKESVGGVLGFVLNTGIFGALNHTSLQKISARLSKPYLVRMGNTVHPKATNGLYNGLCSDNGIRSEEDGGDEMTAKKMVFWGPTCHYEDRMQDGYHVDNVKRGDWIVFPDLGAYGTNCMTSFNGFNIPATHFVFTDLHGDKIQKLLKLNMSK